MHAARMRVRAHTHTQVQLGISIRSGEALEALAAMREPELPKYVLTHLEKYDWLIKQADFGITDQVYGTSDRELVPSGGSVIYPPEGT